MNEIDEINEARTLAEPVGFFFFDPSAKPKLCFPNFLPRTVHVLANVSSACVVSASSQSFVLADEKDMDVIGGNLSEASGIDNVNAFFAKDPVAHVSRKKTGIHSNKPTLGHLKRSRVPNNRCASQASIS
jgi:hypothetical protein